MLEIGRYRIVFGIYPWFQTRGPTIIWRFLFFCILKEARPSDVDKKKRFPIGTPLVGQDGRVYRYWKADKSYRKGEVVIEAREK